MERSGKSGIRDCSEGFLCHIECQAFHVSSIVGGGKPLERGGKPSSHGKSLWKGSLTLQYLSNYLSFSFK